MSILERIASVDRFNEDTQGTLQNRTQDTPRQRPQFQRQRSNTINLGDLGRSRVAGLSTPGDSRPQFDRAANRQSPHHPVSTNATIDPEDSFVFTSLQNYRLSDQENDRISSTSPTFLPRHSSNAAATLRRESSRKDLERTRSKQSRVSSIDVARRASIAVDNVVGTVKDTVSSALRRSSLQEVYEKAKIRQVQLKRSTVAQLSFQYACYLLMLASIYFVFVGFPLWRGLVVTLYYLFNMQLAVPAGTAVFLGIGFL